jgi:predicted secreted protein
MTIESGIAIYLTIWWTTLFAILPLGVRSYAEEGLDVPGGGDPSSPVNPNLKKKFFTTSWISAILFAILWAVLHFNLVTLPSLPASH